MTFDEKLNELISEVEVPDELSPQNIAMMLKAKNAQSKMESEHRNIKSVPSIAAQRRTIIMRTAAATAACAVFAAGMIMFTQQDNDPAQIEEPIDYAAVSPDNYNDLRDIYRGILLDGTENTDETTTTTVTDTTEPPISDAEPEPKETLTDLTSHDFSGIDDPRVSEADIVKTDGTNIYCITDNKLIIISLETMEVVSEIENKLNPPVELYIDGNTLILVSKETEEVRIVGTQDDSTEISQTAADVPASGADSYSQSDDANAYSDNAGSSVNGDDKAASEKTCRTNVVVDLYDISNKTSPEHITKYKQNGSYTSSRIVDGILYVVTAYSDYRTTPLGNDSDLDSYVPAYYIDGEKKFVAAGDITVPANANSTDYTVLSAIDCDAASPVITVKAVLGSSRNVYCSADTLYIVGTGKSAEGSDYSIITSFGLSDSQGMTYKASGSVAGRVISQNSMNEHNGMFRIAASVADENGASSSVYVLDDTLKVVNSAGQLLPGVNVSSVRFENNYASVYTDSSKPAMVLDLSNTPIMQTQSMAGTATYLCSFSEDRLLGFGKSADGSALALTMYNAENGLAASSVTFAEGLKDVDSKAVADRRGILIDKGKSLIGVPVYSHNEFGTKNQYYLFTYGEEGFKEMGVIEYMDIDDSMIFERAAIEGDTLYIIGGRRIISVQLSDLKVIGSVEF